MTIIATARINTKDPDALNTTIKSASTPEGKALAPTWQMVMDSKQGRITWEQYTEQYHALLRKRYAQDKTPFLSILKRNRVVLTCYCTDSTHCHRHLAMIVLQKIAVHHDITISLDGELPNIRS